MLAEKRKIQGKCMIPHANQAVPALQFTSLRGIEFIDKRPELPK
jgi:hypothetical protein